MAQCKRTRKYLPAVVSVLFIASLWAAGQTPASAQRAADAPPVRFDIVSVRENRSDSQKASYSIPRDGDSISYTNYPLFYMVIFSNDFHRSDLVFGLPEWTKNTRYDVVAKVAPEDIEKYHALSAKQRMAMFQQVLADRFKLRFYLEPKELPALEMAIAKGGPKLKAADPKASIAFNKKNGQSILLVAPGTIQAEGGTMADLAMFLTAIAHSEQFVDKTRLTGEYDFIIHYSPEVESGASGPAADTPSTVPDAPSLQTALREQLGVQLKSGKATFDCFVVDHIERPAPD
jgi:uncharacterized protein (TIGR03435 family)